MRWCAELSIVELAVGAVYARRCVGRPGRVGGEGRSTTGLPAENAGSETVFPVCALNCASKFSSCVTKTTGGEKRARSVSTSTGIYLR